MIYVVAGLPRSGMTLTMQMLNAGGLAVAGEWPAFEPYPLGQIPWDDLHGKAVKCLDAHNFFPPKHIKCRVIVPKRESLTEQAKSFNKFNAVCGFPAIPIGVMAASIRRDTKTILAWAKKQVDWMTIDFEMMIQNPVAAARKLNRFCDGKLNEDAAAAVVVKRGTDCLDGLLELQMSRDAEQMKSCAAGADGECNHVSCIQKRDGEPYATGRHCPLPHWTDSRESDGF